MRVLMCADCQCEALEQGRRRITGAENGEHPLGGGRDAGGRGDNKPDAIPARRNSKGNK